MLRTKILRFLSLILAIIMLPAIVPLTACNGTTEDNVLSMYVAYGGPDIIAAEFEQATGIKVELLTMS